MNFKTIFDENLYKKKRNALRRYFRKTYKYLIFEVIPKLKEHGKKDGLYELELPTDVLFEKVYGKMILKFYVEKDKAYFEDITPNDILIACHRGNLPLYKGIPYSTKQELDKIKIVERLL